MAVLVALIRGFVRRQAAEIGNFYVDLTRSTLYILLPLSLLLAIVLVSQGVVQSFSPYQSVDLSNRDDPGTGQGCSRRTVADTAGAQ